MWGDPRWDANQWATWGAARMQHDREVAASEAARNQAKAWSQPRPSHSEEVSYGPIRSYGTTTASVPTSGYNPPPPGYTPVSRYVPPETSGSDIGGFFRRCFTVLGAIVLLGVLAVIFHNRPRRSTASAETENSQPTALSTPSAKPEPFAVSAPPEPRQPDASAAPREEPELSPVERPSPAPAETLGLSAGPASLAASAPVHRFEVLALSAHHLGFHHCSGTLVLTDKAFSFTCPTDSFTVERSDVAKVDNNEVQLRTHNINDSRNRDKYHFSVKGRSDEWVQNLFSDWIERTGS